MIAEANEGRSLGNDHSSDRWIRCAYLTLRQHRHRQHFAGCLQLRC